MIEKNKRKQDLKAKRKSSMPAPKVERTKREKLDALNKKHKGEYINEI